MGKPLLNNGKDSVVKINTDFNWLLQKLQYFSEQKYLVTNYFHYSTYLCNILLLSPTHKFSEFVTRKPADRSATWQQE